MNEVACDTISQFEFEGTVCEQDIFRDVGVVVFGAGKFEGVGTLQDKMSFVLWYTPQVVMTPKLEDLIFSLFFSPHLPGLRQKKGKETTFFLDRLRGVHNG